MLVHINGYPGVGKLTIGRALADQLGAKLLDNHSVYNVAFALTEFKSPEFYDTVRAVRAIAFSRVLALPRELQAPAIFVVNGLLSLVTENVFIATVFINEASEALKSGILDRAQFDRLAIAVNTGTNVPSIATPNGQAAFLFLLTSALAPLIRMSYARMVLMALPYTVMMTMTGFLAVVYLL